MCAIVYNREVADVDAQCSLERTVVGSAGLVTRFPFLNPTVLQEWAWLSPTGRYVHCQRKAVSTVNRVATVRTDVSIALCDSAADVNCALRMRIAHQLALCARC
jgi:hypothetical protein